MNILIAGAGSVGSVLGGLLSKIYKVDFLRRRPPTGKILLKITGIAELETEVNIVTLDTLLKNSQSEKSSKNSLYDIVIFTVQHQHTANVCLELMKTVEFGKIDEHTVLVSLQNGIDGAEIIYKYFRNNPIIAGTVWWSAALIDQQTVYYHRKASTVIGKLGESKTTDHHLNLVLEVLNTAIETRIADDIVADIRKKLILNVVSPILALVKQPYPEGLNDKPTRDMVHALFDEALETANILEWNIDDSDERLNNFHSMLISGDIPSNEDKEGKQGESVEIKGKKLQTQYIHKVSTQLGIEKYGGQGSNAYSLLDWLLLSGSQLADEVIQLIDLLSEDYQPIVSSIFTSILNSVSHAKCIREN